MSKKQIKLVRWPQIILMIVASLVGAFFQPSKKYFLTGYIDIEGLILSVLIFFICLTIAFIMTWYANKPED